MSRDLDQLFDSLARSSFRSRFTLGKQDANYLKDNGLPLIMQHAADFIRERLAPTEPKNDGRQTPWRGHPVFVAQHATATCCRSCLEKWHGFPKAVELSEAQQAHILKVIERWLAAQSSAPGKTDESPREPGLFA